MSKGNHSPAFKKKIALEALREEKTIAQIASQYGVHSVQVGKWKKALEEGAESLFQDKRKKRAHEDVSRAALEQKIGQLTVELDFLKKRLLS